MNKRTHMHRLRLAGLVLGSFAIVAAAFFITLTVLQNFGGSIVQAYGGLGDAIRQIVNPSPTIVKSEPFDLLHVAHTTGTVINGAVIATAPKDHAGLLLTVSRSKVVAGTYQIDITFNCSKNSNANFFELDAKDPRYKITGLDMLPGISTCNGSDIGVALPFKVTRTIDIEFLASYGGTGVFQVKKLALQLVATKK